MQQIDNFLKAYEQHDFNGYSVYDAFNSKFLKPLQLIDNKWVNIAITQLFKQVPFNIRRFFLVEKGINPKSLGLALKATLLFPEKKDFSLFLIEEIKNQRSQEFKCACWGYNWDYFTFRGGTFPKNYPNAIVTYFIADALLDFYDIYRNNEIKEVLDSIETFFTTEINQTSDESGICFSYSPSDFKQIYNASALITLFLMRKQKIEGTKHNSELIGKSLAYLIKRQNPDGSWYYGELENQKWIDSFHTEYMLELFKFSSENGYGTSLTYKKAQIYYFDNFLIDNKICNYFPQKKYPINIHSIASMIIFLCSIQDYEKASNIIQWSFRNLFDAKQNTFYFEQGRFIRNKNVYHRWNQSWMYLALSKFNKEHNEKSIAS